MNAPPLRRAVNILRTGRDLPPTPIGNLPCECRPESAVTAVRLQRELNAQLAKGPLGPVVGTKIGCTTQVMQEYLGMQHPCSGAIFEATRHSSGSSVPYDSYLHVGVECEIAVTLGERISVATDHTVASVASAVRSVHAAIEIVDDRYEDFENRIPDWRTWVADNFFGAGIALGPAVTDWQSIDLADVAGEMQINGQPVGRGFGRDIINGHPLEALAWLANDLGHRGEELPADWIVMLGSVVQTKWVEKGDLVTVHLPQLGEACVSFV